MPENLVAQSPSTRRRTVKSGWTFGSHHDTVWLTQAQMSALFGRERSVVSKHLKNVFREGDLDAESVRAKFAHPSPNRWSRKLPSARSKQIRCHTRLRGTMNVTSHLPTGIAEFERSDPSITDS